MRARAIQTLIEHNFDHWETFPLGAGYDFLHITGDMKYPEYPDFFMTTGIDLKDDLDLLLEKKIEEVSLRNPLMYQLPDFTFSSLQLTEEDIKGLKKVYLFKNEQDIRNL